MPILATLDRSTGRPRPERDRRRMEFASIDGQEVLQWYGGEVRSKAYILKSGITGLRVPTRKIETEQYLGADGARLTDISTEPRVVVLPMFVASDDRAVASHAQQLARIRSFTNYRSAGKSYRDLDGTFDLVTYNGFDPTPRRLRCAYSDGMEGAEGWSVRNGWYFSVFDVKLICVDPYFHGEQWSTPWVALQEATPFLRAAGTEAGPLLLSSSLALGQDMDITVPGDVPTWPIVEIQGPSSSTRITSTSGMDITIGQLGPNDTFTLNTGRHRSARLNGGNAWSKVAAPSRWFPLQPGVATMSIQMADATAGSRARVYGDALWETWL